LRRCLGNIIHPNFDERRTPMLHLPPPAVECWRGYSFPAAKRGNGQTAGPLRRHHSGAAGQRRSRAAHRKRFSRHVPTLPKIQESIGGRGRTARVGLTGRLLKFCSRNHPE
jgi:hypothetical protein